MKTNVFKKKLVLKRETVARLENLEMNLVQGGGDTWFGERTCVTTCETFNGTMCIGLRTDCPCP